MRSPGGKGGGASTRTFYSFTEPRFAALPAFVTPPATPDPAPFAAKYARMLFFFALASCGRRVAPDFAVRLRTTRGYARPRNSSPRCAQMGGGGVEKLDLAACKTLV